MDIKDRCDVIRREGERLSCSDISLNVGYYSLYCYKYRNQYYIIEMLSGEYINLQPILNNHNDWK
jgi:hypothetical protein